MAKKQNSEQWYDLKNVPKTIQFLMAIVPIMAFILRGYAYLFKWGYYQAIGVNRIYIEVESMGSLYSIIACLGIAGIFIASNWLVYLFCVNKKKLETVFLVLVETELFIMIVFVSSNVNVIDALIEMIEYKQQGKYAELLIEIILIICLINIYGFFSV